jgi:hypothetical protein
MIFFHQSYVPFLPKWLLTPDYIAVFISDSLSPISQDSFIFKLYLSLALVNIPDPPAKMTPFIIFSTI